ncbi:cation:proton antiporter subunit C [Thioalkalivibrio sp. XN279]|uniref:cation:proton antiporter subunit C n=1 Tax=Thioalkalivibrio sp. XN279 TaxID=2714953 RepID=UPI00140D554C|nr:cation:proton antiporter subunit C [Thioalkalivibrio sp. XN279]NHA15480.1 cation:proton antiporter subunit C [Thioalkalivibrio sp. XN279]
MSFIAHYNYHVAIILAMIGLYTMISRTNLVKKVAGLNIFQVSVFILFISLGVMDDGTVPILEEGYTSYSNPLPHVLILTAIVVGVATTALALALIIRINEAYGTVEEDQVQAKDEEP